jgi:DNA-binding response OmpR family regulator
MPHETVLIVEDDPAMLRGLKDNFEFEGYRVLTAGDGERGLEAAVDDRPDLVILDIMLPKINGYEICRLVRKAGLDMPILMLTAKGQESDIILGLNLGADDYVTKPFSVRELVARVRAALRRAGFDEDEKDFFDDGILKIDYAGFTVLSEGREVKLTRKEFALLAILARNIGRVVPRERLLDHVWGLEYYGEARTLDVHMSGLRRKLGICGDSIETVIGIVYRLRFRSAAA